MPHHLIKAFKSTLEEAKYSDIILARTTLPNPQTEEQIYVVYETLRQLEVTGKTIVTVFNKIDKLTEGVILKISRQIIRYGFLLRTVRGWMY